MANRDHLNLVELGTRVWNEWYCARPRVMADLTDARFVLRNLSGIVLTGARLNNADLRYANLSDSDLRAAVLTGAAMDRANLSRANLDQVIGLSQRQLDNTIGDASTIIPSYLRRPVSWGDELNSIPAPATTHSQAEDQPLRSGIFAAILLGARS